MNMYRWAILGILATAISAGAADWSRFRGPNGFGTSEDKTIPVEFAPKNQLWKTPIPGKGVSSPIVSEGKVFIQTASEDGSKRSLLCLSLATGKVEWSKDVGGQFARTHDKNSLASSTPAADGKRVYAIFWDGRNIALTAWDYTGKQLWKRDLGPYKSQHGAGLSPMVVGDKVILNIDQDDLAEVEAFNSTTGAPVWKKSRTAYRACYTTPFLLERNGKQELVVASTAGITAYNPADGVVNWNWTWVWKPDPQAPPPKKGGKGGPGGPLRNVGGPIFHDGIVYAYSGDGGGDRHMVAVKAGDKGDVTETNLVWEKKRGTPYVPMLLAHEGKIFWVTDKENLAVCVDAKTGKEHWNERLGGGSQVYASPVLIDGKIYSINEKGTVFVYRAADKFELLAKNDLGEGVYASPAVADGKLLIRGEKNLYCIGTKK